MNYLDYQLELLTPAFISGADQRVAELRSQSIKGLIRWWWRATLGPRYKDVRVLSEQEGRIFGSAALKVKSRMCVFVEAKDLKTKQRGNSPFRSGIKVQAGSYQVDSLEYLAYGPVATVGKREKDASGKAYDPAFNDSSGKAKKGLILKREAILPGQVFTVRIGLDDQFLSSEDLEGVVASVTNWILVGGLGSRSRKGWGAIDVRSISGQPPEFVKLATEIVMSQKSQLLGSPKKLKDLKQLPQWPQWPTRILLYKTDGDKWEEVLGNLGKKYKEIKSKVPKWARWIFGEANPRRASSVFLTLKRNEKKYFGFIIAFPCFKTEVVESLSDWEKLVEKLTAA